MRCVALRCIALHCVALHCDALRHLPVAAAACLHASRRKDLSCLLQCNVRSPGGGGGSCIVLHCIPPPEPPEPPGLPPIIWAYGLFVGSNSTTPYLSNPTTLFSSVQFSSVQFVLYCTVHTVRLSILPKQAQIIDSLNQSCVSFRCFLLIDLQHVMPSHVWTGLCRLID